MSFSKSFLGQHEKWFAVWAVAVRIVQQRFKGLIAFFRSYYTLSNPITSLFYCPFKKIRQKSSNISSFCNVCKSVDTFCKHIKLGAIVHPKHEKFPPNLSVWLSSVGNKIRYLEKSLDLWFSESLTKPFPLQSLYSSSHLFHTSTSYFTNSLILFLSLETSDPYAGPCFQPFLFYAGRRFIALNFNMCAGKGGERQKARREHFRYRSRADVSTFL